MRYTAKDVLKLKPERREQIEALIEAGLSNVVVATRLKLNPHLVAEVKKLWRQEQAAKARETKIGGVQDPPPVAPRAPKVRDEEKRRDQQLRAMLRLLKQEMPLKERVEILTTIARNGAADGYVKCPGCKNVFRAGTASATAGLAAVKEINELEGVKMKSSEPQVAPQGPLFIFPADASRPSAVVTPPTSES